MRSSVRRYTTCAECGVPKAELDLLEQHIKQEHLNDWQPFSCGYCDKRRFTEWQIREHIICHHPHCEARIMFTDNETKSMTLSDIVKRSMENSERHHSRRSAPRVFEAARRESSGKYSGEERAMKTPIIVDVTDYNIEKDKNMVVIDEEYDGMDIGEAGGNEQSDGEEGGEEDISAEDNAPQQSTVDETTRAVAVDDSIPISQQRAPKRRPTRPLVTPSASSSTTSLIPPLKHRASTKANRSLPLTERQNSSGKTKRRKTTHPQVPDGNDVAKNDSEAPQKTDWFTVPGSKSRWYRCKLCKDIATVRTLHVLQKHLSLRVFRCTAANCDYSSHYSSGMVKQHIKHRHGDQPFLQPADDSAIYEKEIGEAYAKCYD